MDASPIPPEPITNINVSIFDISADSKINFTIAWLQPENSYGEIKSYELIVTKEALSGLDSAEPTSSESVIFRKAGEIIDSVSRRSESVWSMNDIMNDIF